MLLLRHLLLLGLNILNESINSIIFDAIAAHAFSFNTVNLYCTVIIDRSYLIIFLCNLDVFSLELRSIILLSIILFKFLRLRHTVRIFVERVFIDSGMNR